MATAPVVLPGKFQGQRTLVGVTESDMAEHCTHALLTLAIKKQRILLLPILTPLSAKVFLFLSKLIIFLFCSETKKYLIIGLSRSQVVEPNSPIGFLLFIRPVLKLPQVCRLLEIVRLKSQSPRHFMQSFLLCTYKPLQSLSNTPRSYAYPDTPLSCVFIGVL